MNFRIFLILVFAALSNYLIFKGELKNVKFHTKISILYTYCKQSALTGLQNKNTGIDPVVLGNTFDLNINLFPSISAKFS